MDGEDYWGQSEIASKALNFDDEEFVGIASVSDKDSDNVLSGSGLKQVALSLNNLISPEAMNMILRAQSCSEMTPDQSARDAQTDCSVSETALRLVTGRATSLRQHRTLRDKTRLLDAAVAIGDGDTIITVVLMLVETLSPRHVCRLLTSRGTALDHYVACLRADAKLAQLTDLLTMLGKCAEADMYQFEHAVKSHSGDPRALLTKLQKVRLGLLATQPDSLLASVVTKYIKLLEWQLCACVDELLGCVSSLQCLGYCCTHHWNRTAGDMLSPLTLCSQQKLSQQQFEWVAMNSHATTQRWDLIEELVTSRSRFGKTSYSSAVPLARLIRLAHASGAENRVLAGFVNKMAGAEERLQVATQYKIESVLVEQLVKARDRVALAALKATLQPHSEEYLLAENALLDPAIKWKN